MDLKTLAKELELENVTVTGNEIRCSCPLAKWTHDKGSDSSPSFGFKLESNGSIIYHCLSCKASGTIHKLLDVLLAKTGDYKYDMIASKIDKVEAGSHEVELTYRKELRIDKDLYEGIFEDVLDYAEARDYIASRGISLITCKRLNIKYDPEEKRLMFFVYDYEGNMVGFQGRSVNGNNIKTRNKGKMPISHVFLGMHKFVLGKPVLLVEGLFMYLRLHDMGYDMDYNILCALGSKVSVSKREFLKGTGSDLYLLFDNDKAGNIGAYGVEKAESLSSIFKDDGIKGVTGELCKHLSVFRMEYPDNIIDPDDLSKEQIDLMLKNAKLMRKV